jgi:predicted Zn-dependent protease
MKAVIFLLTSIILFFGCSKNAVSDNPSNPNAFHNRAVGASAYELLSSNTYKSLKVEVQYMSGFQPDAEALSHLQNFFAAYVNKPNGITIVTKEIASSANTTLDVEEIMDIEKTNRTAFSTANEMAVYILYTNGVYSENNVLGVAYRNTSATLFGKKIKDNSGGFGQTSRTKLEATVLEHEIAHLLGLVDIGTVMQTPHKDVARGSHCNNENCLMYYASETTDVLGFLLTGNIPALDANCVNDLRGNGGK